jgi:hypothetical protein
MSLYRNIAAVVGVCWFACLVWRQLKAVAGWFRAYFLAPWGIARINLKKYGPWAGIFNMRMEYIKSHTNVWVELCTNVYALNF